MNPSDVNVGEPWVVETTDKVDEGRQWVGVRSHGTWGLVSLDADMSTSVGKGDDSIILVRSLS